MCTGVLGRTNEEKEGEIKTKKWKNIVETDIVI